MLKKIVGLLLFVLATLLSIGTFLNFLSAILIKSSKEFQTSFYTGVGYLSATIFFTFLLVLLIRIMFKSAFKLLRKKQLNVDSLDEIGKF